MRGESGIAGEGRVVGVPKFHSWDKCTMGLISTQIECATLPLACVLTYILLTSITAPQDAHTRLVLQVYLGSNTL